MGPPSAARALLEEDDDDHDRIFIDGAAIKAVNNNDGTSSVCVTAYIHEDNLHANLIAVNRFYFY